MRTTWLTAFLDFPAESFAAGAAFWRAVTGFEVSASRGQTGEFAALVPPAGDDYLRLQRLGTGGSRLHLDLSVPDPREAADEAIALGATELADEGYVVLRSPGGLVFCLVAHGGSVRP
ncbi:MAG: VOC family protein, partial [Nocardioides sp.]